MKTGIELIAEERQRQIEVEGFSIENDMQYDNNQLGKAAASYALPDVVFNPTYGVPFSREIFWPWSKDWWKPATDSSKESRIKELSKAGALIAAEIDRLQRL